MPTTVDAIRRALRAAPRLGLALTLSAAVAGCGTLSDEELHSLLGTLSSVAMAAADARNQSRGGVQPAAYQPQGQQAAAGYSSLACVRPISNGAGVCALNACGQPVVYHVRFANGATNAMAVSAGACITVPPGVQVFACQGGHRFDWGRGACTG